MQISFTGHQIEITPALKDYVTEKFDRLYRHFQQISRVNVTFGIEKLLQKVEANIHIPGGIIHARSEDNDMYHAIDSLVDKLDRQLKKHKEKEEQR